MANELTDRDLLGIMSGEIVWNPHTDQWEKRESYDPLIWWKRGAGHSEYHPSSPVPLPKQPPPPQESLPSHEAPGGLTHDQLIRIHLLNDLAAREVITEAARDAEVGRITSESHE